MVQFVNLITSRLGAASEFSRDVYVCACVCAYYTYKQSPRVQDIAARFACIAHNKLFC